MDEDSTHDKSAANRITQRVILAGVKSRILVLEARKSVGALTRADVSI
jgi:hypothetical protein